MLFLQLTIIPERWVTMTAGVFDFLIQTSGNSAAAGCRHRSACALLLECDESQSYVGCQYKHHIVAMPLSVIFHELGHSSALLDAGGSPPGDWYRHVYADAYFFCKCI